MIKTELIKEAQTKSAISSGILPGAAIGSLAGAGAGGVSGYLTADNAAIDDSLRYFIEKKVP